MIQRFEKLTAGVTQIYKSIRFIKKHNMHPLGLKGTHVMCIYYLQTNPQGLTAAELCRLCYEDKAGISRILAVLEKHHYIFYPAPREGKKYRAKAFLTPEGAQYAETVRSLILHFTEQVSAGITEEERETFYRVLAVIADNLSSICADLDVSIAIHSPQKTETISHANSYPS